MKTTISEQQKHIYRLIYERNTLLDIGVSVGRDLITPEIKARFVFLKDEVPRLIINLDGRKRL